MKTSLLVTLLLASHFATPFTSYADAQSKNAEFKQLNHQIESEFNSEIQKTEEYFRSVLSGFSPQVNLQTYDKAIRESQNTYEKAVEHISKLNQQSNARSNAAYLIAMSEAEKQAATTLQGMDRMLGLEQDIQLSQQGFRQYIQQNQQSFLQIMQSDQQSFQYLAQMKIQKLQYDEQMKALRK